MNYRGFPRLRAFASSAGLVVLVAVSLLSSAPPIHASFSPDAALPLGGPRRFAGTHRIEKSPSPTAQKIRGLLAVGGRNSLRERSKFTEWEPRDVRINQPGKFGLREAAIAIDPTNPNHIVALVMDNNYMETGRNPYDLHVANHLFRSLDGGRTWKDLGFISLPHGKGWVAADPSLVFDSTGTLHMADLGYNILTPPSVAIQKGVRNIGGLRVARSRDGGRTWTRPRVISQDGYDKKANTCWIVDKELLGVDPRTDRLYLPYTKLAGSPCDTSHTPVPDGIEALAREFDLAVYLKTSDDGGRTWSSPKTVYDDSYAFGAFPVVGPDGTLHVAFWAHDPYPDAVLTGCPSALGVYVQRKPVASSVVVATSKDGGDSWTYHREVSCPLTGHPHAEQFVVGRLLPSATVDAKENVVYVAWPTAAADGTPATIHVMSSADGGKTWSEPVRATPPIYRDAWMPAISAEDGVVRLTFAATSAVNGEFDIVFTESADQGATWSEPYPLNGKTSPQAEDVGDYMWLTTSGGRIAAIWADARRGPGDIYVRTGNIRP